MKATQCHTLRSLPKFRISVCHVSNTLSASRNLCHVFSLTIIPLSLSPNSSPSQVQFKPPNQVSRVTDASQSPFTFQISATIERSKLS